MKHRGIAKLMAQLYFDQPGAQAVLLQVGFPPQLIPQWDNANAFWSTAMLHMEQGIGNIDIIADLIAQTAETYPGNKEVQDLRHKWFGEPAAEPGTGRAERADGPHHTLTLIGANLSDEFLAAVRQQFRADEVDLLYVSKEQCAVAIPDPGPQAYLVQQQLQDLMQTHAAHAQVVYEQYSFRPYLYSSLTVDGPDGSPYLLQAVPATMTPGDIAAAIVADSRALSGAGGPVSTVVDAVTDDGPRRLDPETTLHENKVRDKGKLRVGTKVVAGSVDPEMRMEAQLRMRQQMRRFAFGHQDFAIVDYDDEDLPNSIVFELDGPGLAPPPDLADFLAGAENYDIEAFRAMPWERLVPVRIGSHRFTMHLPGMFPMQAPFVVWNSPVFHPNIWRSPAPGILPGMVCLGPLMDGYRPDLDFGSLCQLLIDIGTYRNYDVVDASTYPDPPAALWARTEAGQQIIKSIGGPPMRTTTERADERPPGPALWLRLLAEHQAEQPDEVRQLGEAPHDD